MARRIPICLTSLANSHLKRVVNDERGDQHGKCDSHTKSVFSCEHRLFGHLTTRARHLDRQSLGQFLEQGGFDVIDF